MTEIIDDLEFSIENAPALGIPGMSAERRDELVAVIQAHIESDVAQTYEDLAMVYLDYGMKMAECHQKAADLLENSGVDWSPEILGAVTMLRDCWEGYSQ
jgi:hypothetical protein